MKPLRMAFIARQQMKSWAQLHTGQQWDIATCEEIFSGQHLKHREKWAIFVLKSLLDGRLLMCRTTVGTCVCLGFWALRRLLLASATSDENHSKHCLVLLMTQTSNDMRIHKLCMQTVLGYLLCLWVWVFLWGRVQLVWQQDTDS